MFARGAWIVATCHAMDFSHLQQLKVTDANTADYVFHNIPGEPVLQVKYAGESNKPYFNELLRKAEHLAKRKAKINVGMIQDNRERDTVLYPRHIVVGWSKPPVDKNGVPAPYTRENVEAFLKAIPTEEFDELRDFCRDPYNFRDEVDTASAAGNSPTG